jgi:hypothetical protein
MENVVKMFTLLALTGLVVSYISDQISAQRERKAEAIKDRAILRIIRG